MRTLWRNQRVVYYCNPTPPVQGQTDVDGFLAGDRAPQYDTAVAIQANVAPPTGRAAATMFGLDIRYDRVLLLAEHPSPIKEGAAMFIEKEPEYDNDGTPVPDYVVVRVADSLNFSHVAVRRVEVKP